LLKTKDEENAACEYLRSPDEPAEVDVRAFF